MDPSEESTVPFPLFQSFWVKEPLETFHKENNKESKTLTRGQKSLGICGPLSLQGKGAAEEESVGRHFAQAQKLN